MPSDYHGCGVPLHKVLHCVVEVVHHFVAAPPPNDPDGAGINVSKEQCHGATGS